MQAPVELNCQNLPCPQPVLKCKRCLEEQAPAALAVVVDNPAAKDNVTRFLTNQGYAVEAQADGPIWRLTATKSGADAAPVAPAVQDKPAPAKASEDARTVVFLTSDLVGRGDDDLGGKLMHNFLATLPELGPALWRLILVNGAVRLACEGNADLPALEKLAASGVDILVCGTCLDHYGLLEKKKIGETTNMLDVVTSLHLADKVIQV